MSNILPDSPALVASEAQRMRWFWQRPAPGRSSRTQLPFRDLSYRFKIPFSVSVVILVTALIVSAVLIARSYQYLRTDLIANAESLGKTLSRALTPALLRDEMWQAYETIITPFGAQGRRRAGRAPAGVCLLAPASVPLVDAARRGE
jgi:hypothetical protein